ncbi:hypothetical protein ABZZ17_00845 [Streptomyces sp. NPDC006512]|uniref:hypothetical protein n=1 Tax=Streptomyces sp. NPDC006512 TaxID=3154307 RepID=UPI0033B8B31F
MSDSPRITARHLLPCAVVLLASLLCGGCAGQHEKAPDDAGSARQGAAGDLGPVSTARPATLQEIAAVLGCTPEITVDAEELKEAACGQGRDAYRMTTFSADQGQRAWLTESSMYGGTYLVGNRWVVTAASAEALAPLRERLGGTVANGASHAAAGQPEDHPGGLPGGPSATPGDAGHAAGGHAGGGHGPGSMPASPPAP